LFSLHSNNTNAPFILFLPVIVASSNSTDETIVADSDVEMETASSAPIVAASKSQHIEHNSDDKVEITNATGEDAVSIGGTNANVRKTGLEKVEVSKSMEDGVKVIEQPMIHRFQARDENIRTIKKVPKDENVDISRDGTSDVIFSQDLVVKSFPSSTPDTSTETGGVNFKRFRKVCFILFHQLVFFLEQTTV
jgi:nibrin